MAWSDIEKAGGIAVVTGGASGVGRAAAEHLGAKGFEVLLADIGQDALEVTAADLRRAGITTETCVLDVSDPQAVDSLADQAFAMGPVSVVMNNAGIARPSSTLEPGPAWRDILEVNFFGVLNGVHSFVPRLIAAGRPAAIINTGSKQGITTPPGNPAYNVSKAAVKVLSEQLAHELREASAPVDVHLFVPGFTYTGMIAAFMPEKPAAAWTSEECITYLFDRIGEGDFYVLCPDNAVTPALDARRVLWSAGDIAENRPPLSRWHPDWAEQFAAFEADRTD